KPRGRAGSGRVLIVAVTAVVVTAAIAPVRAIRPSAADLPPIPRMFVRKAPYTRAVGPDTPIRVARPVSPQESAPRRPVIQILGPELRALVHQAILDTPDGELPSQRVLSAMRAYRDSRGVDLPRQRFERSNRR